MAASEALAIERLAAADVDRALRLSDAARWNQTADDWAHFIANGDAFGIRDDADGLIATAAALPYGASAGWISMVLVDARHRHRGHATRLLGTCVNALRARDCVPVLDATPDGARVYGQAGFVPGFAFERWQRSAPAPSETAGSAIAAAVAGGESRGEDFVVVGAADPRQRNALLALDRSLWGFDRGTLLRAFLARPGTRAWLAGDAGAFAILRAGRRAQQLGPLVALDEAQAIRLLHRVLDAATADVFVDVPTRSVAFARALAERGFVRQRPFVRMALVDTPALHAGGRVFALAGPEFG